MLQKGLKLFKLQKLHNCPYWEDICGGDSKTSEPQHSVTFLLSYLHPAPLSTGEEEKASACKATYSKEKTPFQKTSGRLHTSVG